MAAPTKQRAQFDEIIKCGKDPEYFLKKYVKIQHPTRGKIPFETYSFQDDCLKSFQDHRFNIILKSRQLGLSTISAGYALWLAIFYKDKNILVIATKLKTAINFIKKVKFMLNSLPVWMTDTLQLKTNPTTQELKFSNGSIIAAVPTSEDAGRSEGLSLLIVDEAAHIRGFGDLWTGLYPTLSTGGNAIILSTPAGVGGMYHKLWIDAESGENEFNTIKLPWFVHPEHDQEWFDKETRNLSRRAVAQEFLCSFLSSGDTFLQAETMERVATELFTSQRSTLDRNIWVWDDAVPGGKYIIGADVSRGDAKDFSAFHVINVETQSVDAEYMGKLPPDKFAKLLFDVGTSYNDAVLIVENNSFGYHCCSKLIDLKYPRIYYDKMKDLFERNIDFPEGMKPGFSTQFASRQNILVKLEELIRNNKLRIRSQRLYDQLQTFIWIGQKPQSMRDCNDDLVLSLAIGAYFACDIKASDIPDTSMERAMLKATSVARREVSHLRDEVKGMNRPPRMGDPFRARPADVWDRRGSIVGDLRWLYR